VGQWMLKVVLLWFVSLVVLLAVIGVIVSVAG
jgi:hypothetical protein